MKIGAVVLARSNFGRWPEKLKADLGGKPVIERVIERLVKVKGLDEIILSTTDYSEDKWLMNLAGSYGIQFTTGPPDDRGLRYYEAVMEYNLDYFMPWPANWPFAEIELLEEVVLSAREKPSYVGYRYMRGMPDGLCVGLASKQVIEFYKDCEDDQEMWWKPSKDKHLILHDWQDVDLRNKYLIQLNIAYPLEVALYNKMIEYLGFYPECYNDIKRAYTEMKTL